MDEAVIDVATQRLVGVGDLVSRGLTYNLGNGLGTTVLEYEDVSDMNDAQLNMDAQSKGQKDRVEFDINYLPLPITHKDFDISIRVLEASRKLGRPLDVTQAMVASRKVSELVETTLFTGASTYTFGGGTIYGYMDFPQRNTVSFSVAAWDASAATSAGVLADVIAMKAASVNDRHYGPWVLYIPTAYETVMDGDYSTATSTVTTLRERILQIGGIQDVKVADFLTADNVVLVEMSPETVRMVIGMPMTNVEWDTPGGMISNFKVMTIMVPQLRADQDDRCGIVHLS